MKKPTKILYLKIIPKCRLKVEIYGDVRPEILTEIKNTIHYIPEDYKEAFKHIKVLRIYKKSNANRTNAFYRPKDASINIFDKSKLYPSEYSQTFLHEFGHLLFTILTVTSEEYSEEYENDNEELNDNPFWNFVDEVNNGEIKPISNYSQYHQRKIKNKKGNKKFESKADYANELFAEYFGFTYCRYTIDEDVKGTFCNYIELRNAYWRLIDGFNIGSHASKFC